MGEVPTELAFQTAPSLAESERPSPRARQYDVFIETTTQMLATPKLQERLLLAHNECTFIWSNRDGWPVGVIMSYVWRRGRFWLTASSQRARVSAVRRDPRVCVVVTSTGSPLPRNKTETIT